MRSKINNLNSQTTIVIKQLMINNKMSRTDAFDTWMQSKTKKKLEELNIFYVSGIRCYVELIYELNGDPKWMKESFE